MLLTSMTSAREKLRYIRLGSTENILKSLNHVVNIHDLRSCDVQKIYKINLDSNSIAVKNSTGVIITYDNLSHIKFLCHQISTELKKRENIKYYFVIIPQVTSAIEFLLEEEGLYGIVEVYSLLWQPVVIDTNLISLELPHVFSSLFLEKNLLLVPSLTRSLEHLFALFGQPKNTFIHGEISIDIYERLNEYCFKQSNSNDIDYFIMFDRSLDYASVLLTPVTYVGLLDQTFGITNESIEINSSATINKRKDPVLKEIKYKNFIDVSNYLKEKSRFIQSEQNKYNNNMSVLELKQYINQDLKSILELKKQVATHIAACESILNNMGEYYAEITELENNIISDIDRSECYEHISNMLLGQKITKEHVLQIMCLLSYYNQGMQGDHYNEFKSNYFNIHGYEHMTTFYNLEKIKLLTKRNTMNITDTINAQTQMLNNELRSIINKLKASSDIPSTPSTLNRYYVSRIVELIVTHKYSVDNLCKLFPSNCQSKIYDTNISKDKLTFVLCAVGGITHNEIACLSTLEKNLDINILIYTSNLINAANMLQQCMS
ncbi:vacuolar protein sorting-associated protein 33B [Diaphorina citri]|uniref:Vacuolar protein sorting-associated protein 33B n=1 Tax=Diaphorina citri TaxID=121845 RepID=A0A1S3DG53_DIACI|nr:vacuolar protein sorting-associated protein 33B [Diaphorina citri]